MKIGIMTDIHNNVDALNAVLDKFDSLGVEKIKLKELYLSELHK